MCAMRAVHGSGDALEQARPDPPSERSPVAAMRGLTLNSFDPDRSLARSKCDLRGVKATMALSFLEEAERTGLET